ncbi:hypothetical protein ASE19_11605 [Nocardioides sp. Root79]|nr:hypothetical protein ASE19_11605 [Nocardioides sp. Root79]KRC72560.1 hypothetical protein ASE20_08135 [Nocardioides sp. Root240]
MTQAEVAAGEVTAAYLSRVERGQRRLAAPLLERIAGRLHTTAAELLATHSLNEARTRALRVEEAAVLVAIGEYARAEEVAAGVLGRLDAGEDGALRASAVRVRAEALLALGDHESAVSVTEPLVDSNDLNAVRALILLGRCHCALDAPARAMKVIDLAERLISTLGVEGLGESLWLAAVKAEAQCQQGRFHRASQICRDGLAASAHLPVDADASRYLRAAAAESMTGGATPAAMELTTAALTILDARNGLTALRSIQTRAEALT